MISIKGVIYYFVKENWLDNCGGNYVLTDNTLTKDEIKRYFIKVCCRVTKMYAVLDMIYDLLLS